MGLRKIMYKAKITAVNPANIQTCERLMVTIDPNKNVLILTEALPSERPINTSAIAIPPDISIAIDISEYER